MISLQENGSGVNAATVLLFSVTTVNTLPAMGMVAIIVMMILMRLMNSSTKDLLHPRKGYQSEIEKRIWMTCSTVC